MLNVRLHQLAKTAPKFLNETNGLEVMLAKCELYFCANKSNQAFKLLETSYEEIKKDYSEFYQEVLNYFIEQSIKWNRKDLEIKYLKEIFLHGLFILPERLKSYLNLFPKEKREEELNQLYGLVKKNPFNYSFDKVMVILWEAKRWDELIKEIKNQKSKFPLLHSVLIQKLPHYNSVDLDLYLKHLTSAILEKEFYPYQLKMVDMARDYLQNLPKNEMEPFMQNLLDGLLKQSQIYRYLKLEYNLD